MKLNILIVLNYYYPYISGLSECAKCLAEELAKDHNVTVLTSKHDESLNENEVVNGVQVIRANLLAKVSKGYVSWNFWTKFIKLQKQADIVNLHLPMAEAAALSCLVTKRKLLITYQCDVNLPKSLINSTIVNAMDLSSIVACHRANKVVVSSLDYASHSRILPRFMEKLIEIHPTSSFYRMLDREKLTVREKNVINIGFCGRIVEEKGVDVLLRAAPIIKEKIPKVKFLIAGDYKNVAGGSVYNQLQKELGWDDSYINFLGKLNTEELIDFYYSLDLFVLPSTNSLEAFGMVQVEAMLAGVPVVASDLPGVRQITKITGMGETAEPKNPNQLAHKVIKVLNNKSEYFKEKEHIQEVLGIKSAADKYIACFSEMTMKE